MTDLEYVRLKVALVGTYKEYKIRLEAVLLAQQAANRAYGQYKRAKDAFLRAERMKEKEETHETVQDT
jgi:hypothetical protein